MTTVAIATVAMVTVAMARVAMTTVAMVTVAMATVHMGTVAMTACLPPPNTSSPLPPLLSSFSRFFYTPAASSFYNIEGYISLYIIYKVSCNYVPIEIW